MFTPRKTVRQMVEEAKTRIENLSLKQLQTELQSGEIVSVEGTAGDDTIQLLINRCHRQRSGHLPRRGASDIMNG